MAKQRVKLAKKGPPEGYDKIKPTLDTLKARVQAAQKSDPTASASQRRWPIAKADRAVARYVYEMFYKRRAISKELYDWLVGQPEVNADLIAKWRKLGYEKLCCVLCIVGDTTHGTTCVCRVPKLDKPVECVTCGCTGCSSETGA